MSATIKINGVLATVDCGNWTCDDPELLQRLEGLMWIGSYKTDEANAYVAIEQLGGELVEVKDDDEPYDPNLLY